VTGGTYTLVTELPERATIEVGALGNRDFDPGWYAYVGSAHGSGGFQRVQRHQQLAAGDRDTRHWHIDYLLGHRDARIDAIERIPHVDGECQLAGALDGAPVPGFGCSDCGCHSHLFYSPSRASLLASIVAGHKLLQQRQSDADYGRS
jgi:Uri superfamily endonuclease